MVDNLMDKGRFVYEVLRFQGFLNINLFCHVLVRHKNE